MKKTLVTQLRRLTDRLIPDDAVFLFIFKAWNPRIARYVRVSTTQKMGKKTSSGGMRLFGNRLSCLCLFLCVLSACGFHLRGQLPQLDHLSSPWHIQGLPKYSALYQAIQRQLNQAGIQVVDTEGQRHLIISELSSNSRLFSLDNHNAAIETELEMSFRFALRRPTQDIPVEPTLLRTSRILYQPQGERLSSDRETARLQSDMQRELVTRMLRLLAAKTPTTPP